MEFEDQGIESGEQEGKHGAARGVTPALKQGLGTSKIPPQSFLGFAASNKERAIVQMIGEHNGGSGSP